MEGDRERRNEEEEIYIYIYIYIYTHTRMYMRVSAVKRNIYTVQKIVKMEKSSNKKEKETYTFRDEILQTSKEMERERRGRCTHIITCN